jgi:valyl-tRNA synthetase
MRNIHDWCISRQLWCGHRIPAWHCGKCGGITVARDAPEACEHCSSEEITQETDVLDTWFSSGLLPFTSLGWDGDNSKPTADLAAFYPTDLLVTGFDILFFWVARMIMLGCHFMLDVPMPDGSPRSLAESVPFREVYIHGLVRDADRQKMSKTKGNVIDPIEVITRYGTDAVRFTLASQASPGTDIAFSEARTEGYRAFANKIWNAARFVQMQIDRASEAGYKVSLSLAKDLSGAPLETRWIVARLHAVAEDVSTALGNYRFDEAANAVYQFFWGEFCDWYVELVKLRLDFTTARNDTAQLTLNALVSVFETALRLLSPFMPFLTEELWHALYGAIEQQVPAKSIALMRFPLASEFAHDDASVGAMQTLQELIVTVRALRKDLGVPEKEAAPIRLHSSDTIARLSQENADMLSRLARVSGIEQASKALTGNNARSTANFDVAVVYERQMDVAAERERLNKERAKYEKGLQSAEKQLGNPGFVAKAPAHIIEGLKKQIAELRALKKKAQDGLDSLPPQE